MIEPNKWTMDGENDNNDCAADLNPGRRIKACYLIFELSLELHVGF